MKEGQRKCVATTIFLTTLAHHASPSPGDNKNERAKGEFGHTFQDRGGEAYNLYVICPAAQILLYT